MKFHITTTDTKISKDRLKTLISKLDDLGIKYQLNIGAITPKHFDGLQQVIKDIIKENINKEYIILCEDDACLTNDFSIDNFIRLIKKAKDLEFDVLNTGAWYSTLENKTECSKILSVDTFRGSQLIVLFKSSYEQILSFHLYNYFEDNLSHHAPKLKLGLTIPFLSIQEENISLIREKSLNKYFKINEERLLDDKENNIYHLRRFI